MGVVGHVGTFLDSPGINAGRGLKLIDGERNGMMRPDSPGINAGRGLKLHLVSSHLARWQDSPGINAGRGLKQG